MFATSEGMPAETVATPLYNPTVPVEVTPLHAEEVERTRDEALTAFTRAADLAALQEAKIAHLGDRSPIVLANREFVVVGWDATAPILGRLARREDVA